MKESLQVQEAEKSEHQEFMERAYKAFPAILKEEAAELREGGFPIDDNLRIRPEEFKGYLSPAIIAKDREFVQRVEKENLIKAEKNPKIKEQMIRGEVLEMAKSILLNDKFFDKKLIVVRTSKFDDFVNDVDQLIFDTETFEPMAAVDITTSWQAKLKNENVKRRIKEGAQVQYGVEFGPSGIQKKILGNLPFFIIQISPEELVNVVGGIMRGFSEEEQRKLERHILTMLKMEAAGAQKMAYPKTAAGYQRAEKVFDRLLGEK